MSVEMCSVMWNGLGWAGGIGKVGMIMFLCFTVMTSLNKIYYLSRDM